MPAPGASAAPDIVVGTPRERLAELAQLSDAIYGPHEDMSHASYYDWLYEKNPAGPAVSASAFVNGQLVAHYAVVPVALWRGGRIVRAGLGVNALTRREAQGRGLFARLVARVDREAAVAGLTATYAVPGPESEPWFRSILKYSGDAELALFVRPVRLSRIAASARELRRVPRLLARVADLVLAPASLVRARAGRGRFDIRELSAFGPEVDDLWRRVSPSWDLGIARTAEFLSWRYRTPTRAYRTLGAWREGRLVALVAFRFKHSHHLPGVLFGSIVDVVAEPGAAGERAAALLVGDAAAALTREGADVLVCQMHPGSPAVRALAPNGVMRVRVRRAYRPIVFRGLAFGAPGTPQHFSGADYDMG
jgi:hypothetical protein